MLFYPVAIIIAAISGAVAIVAGQLTGGIGTENGFTVAFMTFLGANIVIWGMFAAYVFIKNEREERRKRERDATKSQ